MNKQLKELIDSNDRIVFFGGAGVSTESGIPDFRSESGLYNAQQKFGYSPEQMISHSFFLREPELFYKYYKENMIFKDAEPNDAHKTIAKLENENKLSAVITQNIDGLHQKAGSQTVYELHGSVHRNYCMDCGAKYDLDYVLNSDDIVPRCEKCDGIVRPDVVLYEEPLNESTISGAITAIQNADMLIVGGTSLVVYPAAGFLNYFRGENLVLINKSETSLDSRATLVLRDAIGEEMRLD